MKGICNNDELRVVDNSGLISISQVIGAKVYIKSITMGSTWNWKDSGKKTYTIKDVGFRISTDGKCFTTLTLEECDGIFTLKDIEFVKLGGESDG